MSAWNTVYPRARQKLVERSLAGPMLVTVMRSKIPGVLAWPPKGRQKESKQSCLEACIPNIRAGNVYLPLRPDGTKPRWVEEFIEEMRLFPRAPHDDFVDMFTQAHNFMFPSVVSEEQKAKALAELSSIPEDKRTADEKHTQGLHQLLNRNNERNIRQIRRKLNQPPTRPTPEPLQNRLLRSRLYPSRGGTG